MNAESKTDQFFPNPSSLLSREDVAHALHISDKTLRYILFVIRPENIMSLRTSNIPILRYEIYMIWIVDITIYLKKICSQKTKR